MILFFFVMYLLTVSVAHLSMNASIALNFVALRNLLIFFFILFSV